MAYPWHLKAVDPHGRLCDPRTPTAWVRFARGERCSVCGRPDWCTRSADGSLFCCMRVKSPRAAKNGGWIHEAGTRLPEVPIYAPLPSGEPLIDCEAYMARWGEQTPPGALEAHAATLGLHAPALARLGAAWAPERKAWAFPMRDGTGRMVGIRLRAPADAGARKWSVVGSRQGLFIPTMLDLAAPVPLIFLCEGPTDTAAILGLGLNAIGRPNDRGGGEFICTFLARLGRAVDAVVMLDAGESGIEGGEALASMLHARRSARTVRTLLPPDGIKDARAWVRTGVGAALVRTVAMAQAPWIGSSR